MFIMLPITTHFFDLRVNGAENILRPANSDERISNTCISAAANNVNIEVNAGNCANQVTNGGFFVISNTKMFNANKQLNIMGTTKNVMLK
jgi:hypothetical protein